MKKPEPKRKNTSKGKIKPHEGDELALMLKGKKPLARFALEHKRPKSIAATEAAFRPYVERGILLRFQFKGDEFDRIYYCRPSEEWRVKVLELVDRVLELGVHDFTIYDLHRLDGTLLGYDKTDIEHFVATWRRHHPDD
ncbi:MAG: hemin receptor [Alphaproteobacteria bacterium]|nr:hemin receptor [Alphaproteobacteria bacterium]